MSSDQTHMPLKHPRRALLPALAMLLLPTAASNAQGKGGPEFVRQSLVVGNFVPSDTADKRLGRAAGDAVRSKIGKVVNGRELAIVGGTPIRDALRATGFEENQFITPSMTRAFAAHLRADEFLVGAVRNTPEGPQLSAWLVLTRDPRLRQPLPAVVGREMDIAAERLAAQIVAARTQLAPLRRCENALRAGQPEQAARHAREAIVAYPRAAMARVCLLWGLRASPSGTARQVLVVARELLAIDSANAHGLESAAIALDSLHESREAGAHWTRLAQTDSTDVELSERVFEALMADGNTVRAESLVTPLVAIYPSEPPLRWQWFRSAFANRSWKRAVQAGENLLARDSSAHGDSLMQRQLAVAYASNGQPVQAVETLARGVRTFPGDARIYALYAQYVRAESDTVIPRGLALFPR